MARGFGLEFMKSMLSLMLSSCIEESGNFIEKVVLRPLQQEKGPDSHSDYREQWAKDFFSHDFSIKWRI